MPRGSGIERPLVTILARIHLSTGKNSSFLARDFIWYLVFPGRRELDLPGGSGIERPLVTILARIHLSAGKFSSFLARDFIGYLVFPGRRELDFSGCCLALFHDVVRKRWSVRRGFEGHVVSRVWRIVEERSKDPRDAPGSSK